jgi:hypothetical protein
MEILMDIILTLVLVIVAFILGWNFRGAVILANLARKPEDMIKILQKIQEINQAEDSGDPEALARLDKDATELAIERVGDHLYAYAKDNNQFIAQGADLKDLLAQAHKRFPGRVFFGNIPEDSPAKELA